MSQTKHRGVRVDRNSDMDEAEQVMHVKDYRAKKKSGNMEIDLDDDFINDPMYAEVEFLLRKNR